MNDETIGAEIHALARELWPLDRSLTGDGVRATLKILQRDLPGLKIHEVPTGTQVFDWTIPKEWRPKDAYIVTPDGRRICDFKANNLHLLGYSAPFRGTLSLAELQEHLYSLPDQPDAIPYITSYYKEQWGFCLAEDQRKSLPDGNYQVVVDTELFSGSLSYGELILKGRDETEVLLSTNVCHPSMANNELSGPCVTAFVARWLASLPDRRHTYRIVFIPETIGSVAYLARNLDAMKDKVVAGFCLSCIGDERQYSYMPSRAGDTLSDAVAKHVLRHIDPGFVSYTWADRGSDERQYCAPHVDLPIASLNRTKYFEYPEYHTSLDDLETVVTPAGLAGGYRALKRCVEALEHHCRPSLTVKCEPQLGKRGLYPSVSTKTTRHEMALLLEFITWSDGRHTLLEIAEKCGAPVWELYPLAEKLAQAGLLEGV